MKKVLCLLHEEAHLDAMLPLVQSMKNSGRFQPLAFIDDRMAASRLLERCRTAGVAVLNDGGDAVTPSWKIAIEPARARRQDRRSALARVGRTLGHLNEVLVGRLGSSTAKLLQPLRRRVPNYVNTQTYYVLRSVEGTSERIERLASILETYQIDIILMCEDNVEFNTVEWILAGHRTSTASVCVPYTIANSLEFAVPISHDERAHRSASRLNDVVCRLFPHWKYTFKGTDLIRMPSIAALAKELSGTAPAHPWLLNSGPIDAIAVESEVMRRLAREQRLPCARLEVTGSCADDRLAEGVSLRDENRTALLKKYGMPQNRPLLLCALPPDQGSVLLSRSEFADFKALVAFWAKTLRDVQGWNVVVRPHPKTPIEDLAVMKEHGLAVDLGETAKLVPLCDVYVACVSATIRWAVACGIPAVNYDAYRYGFEDYKDAPGVILAQTRDEFTQTIGRITQDHGYRQQLADAQQRVAGDWARLDGRARQRIVDLIDELSRPCEIAAKAAQAELSLAR